MRNKKRILLIVGAILFIGASVAFGISRWYYWRGGTVMDGPGEFYSRMYRMYNLFRNCEAFIAMIILITGASHTGKTVLAQKMLEKYGLRSS